MAKEQNINIDEDGFLSCMNVQKERSRSNAGFKYSESTVDWKVSIQDTESNFIGYDKNISNSKIINFRNLSDDESEIILNNTPFYAESGGQIGDIGFLKSKNFLFKVKDTQKKDDKIIHIGTIKKGKIKLNNIIEAEIDISRRKKIKSNHTATHLLHSALKQVLGDHVQQSGSLVSNEPDCCT
jgi:alanyl-tRNA synthetase